MKKKYSLLLLLLPLLFGGCADDDFDTNAEYREIAIIYGLLDLNATKQFVRVNLGFQNSNGENAIILAKEDPTIKLYEDSITVAIHGYNANGTLMNTALLTKELLINKELGDFNNTQNYWYTVDTSQLKLKGNYTYEVEVVNNVTGVIHTAQTNIVNEFCITSPTLFPRCENPGPPAVNFLNSLGPRDVSVKFKTDPNAQVYKVLVDFHYKEFVNNDTSTTQRKIMSTTVNSNLFANAETTSEAEAILNGETFMNQLAIQLDTAGQDPTIKRVAGDFVVTVVAAGDHVAESIRAEDAFSAITQTKPFYTNVYDADGNQGAGIFSSRYYQTKVGVVSTSTVDLLKAQYPGFKF